MTGAVEVTRLTIPGEPFAKQRPRARPLGKGRVTIYTPPETVQAEAKISTLWMFTHPDYVPDPEARYGVSATFYRYAKYRRDQDNLLKLVLDALNGLAWADDYQVELYGQVATRWVAKAEARTEFACWKLGTVPTLLGVEPATLDG